MQNHSAVCDFESVMQCQICNYENRPCFASIKPKKKSRNSSSFFPPISSSPFYSPDPTPPKSNQKSSCDRRHARASRSDSHTATNRAPTTRDHPRSTTATPARRPRAKVKPRVRDQYTTSVSRRGAARGCGTERRDVRTGLGKTAWESSSSMKAARDAR